MKKDLALFDFDGTITDRDSFIDFIKYYRGNPAFYRGFAKLLPALLLYKCKLIPNWRAKEMVLTHFFGGESVEVFQQTCDTYATQRIPEIVKAKALEKIREHQRKGDTVYIVSASAENWLAAWCREIDVKLIATKLEVQDGKVTGKIMGQNCYGQEKVNRIQAILTLTDHHQVHAYGDSAGDHAMLSLAHFPNYRVFK